MDSLFSALEKESNAKVLFEKKVFDVVPGQGAFHQQPPHVKKIIRKEHVLINGKSKVIRRVYCKSVDYLAYQNVGWVLYTDVQNCMLCQKAFPRLISRHMGLKKHCHICGNIVCGICLNVSAVRIKEFKRDDDEENAQEYVDACANCFWGQDEISISVTPVPEQKSVREAMEVFQKGYFPAEKLSDSSRSAPISDDMGDEKEESNKVVVQVGRVQWERDESCKVEEEDEEYDIEVVANSSTIRDKDNNPEESLSPARSLSNDDQVQSFDDNMNDMEEISEQGVVSDVNRLNLMMLLSTISVVNDNNPNDVYNVSKGEENFRYDNYDNPDYVITYHSDCSNSEVSNDSNALEDIRSGRDMRSAEMTVSLDDVDHEDMGDRNHDGVYESAEDMARLNNWESFL